MKKLDDFDLDLKKVDEENKEKIGISDLISITQIPSELSRAFGCTPVCPKPTLGEGQKPVASCRKNINGVVQPRC